MTFASRPATKENLRLRNDSRNEFLTRSKVIKQRVSHSFRRAPTQSNESHTRSDELRARSKFTTHESHTRADELRARCRFATQGRDQQATTVLSEHHNKEQRKRTQRRSAAMFAVFCSVSCALLSFTLEPDSGLCARMDERTCIRVITVDVTSSAQAENKCSAVALWMVRHKHSS